MKVSEVEVTLSDGRRVPLAELYADGPVALVFLRHFGCVFCREHVAQLRPHPDLNVAFVSMGEPEESEAFRKAMDSPHKFVCDPDAELYQAFDLERGKLSQLFGPRVFVRGAQATLKGHGIGKPIGDPFQMPGSFVVDQRGEIAWGKVARDAADNATPQELKEAIEAASREADTQAEAAPKA